MSEAGTPRIAVVGMAGRFPGAPGIDELWILLRDGREPSVELSDAELLAAGVDPALLADPAYVKRAALLDGIDRFDARFFGYTPREAATMDPQHRLFLEAAWHALEDAGHGAEEDAGPVAVFAGESLDTYARNNLYPDRDFVASMEDLQALMSVDGAFLATRVAYHRNLTGPAVVVQSTCSTSLLAICQACQSLLQYGSDLAVAGGVSVRVPERRGYLYQPGGILSPDGRCRPFDARAAGTYFSNGVGAVVLRRLEDALADGDSIHAVIRGWAVNNDGASKVGYTAPSVEGQAAVIAMAQELAGVDPATIGCVEAHGTATALGDPIEVAALTRAFRGRSNRRGTCALGSVKSNFGHLDAAAGVAGFLKTVLSLKHGRIPPSLHFERPNPNIDFGAGPFFVNGRLAAWPDLGAPRRAGVSSFGIGGTNAHVVLEEAPPAAAVDPPSRPFELLVVSAKTEAALAAQAESLAGRLAAAPDVALADVAHTLQTGRRGFARRRAHVCRDAQDSERALRAARRGAPAAEATDRPDVAFLFPGQGAQYAGMGQGLRDAEPEFRRHVDECAAVLEPLLGLDIREAMLDGGRLTDTELAQPALFTVEYALARTWMKWGVHPAAMIGHSVGEYVAACLSGVMSPSDALSLIAARGKLMQRLPRGAMLAVPLSPEAASSRLDGGLALAASNAPELSVVSGPIPAVEALEVRLREEGIAGRRLHTSHAFHSAMMDPILEDFAREVRRAKLDAPRIPYVSNVTGRWVRPEEATDPAYWATHLRQTVRFSEGVAELLHRPVHLLLEVGPGRALGALAGHHRSAAVPAVAAVPSLRDARDPRSDVECLLDAAGRLWEAGVEIDWRAFRGGERRRRIPLPGYPFERERHWVEPRRGTGRSSTPRSDDAAGRFWIPSWRRSSVPPAPARVAERWLVIGGDDELTRRLTGALAGRGCEVIAGEGRAPNVLWTRSAPGEGVAAGSEDEELELAFFGPVLLARALAGSGEHVRLVVVTHGAQDVWGTEELVPERAAAAAACRVISREMPDIAARCIDVENGRLDSPERIDALVAEALSGETDPLVAHRGGYRWLPALEPVRIEAGEAAGSAPPLGAWIVTGGLGGLGLEIAAHLARKQRAKLVLVSRRGPDAERLRRVAEIESLGGEVEIVRGDVSRADDIAATLARARARFGKVHGVIHAAGVAGAHALEETTRTTAAPVLLPKIAGAKLLVAACEREGCERLVLFSSLASRFGGVGQGDYAAANAVLEAIGAAAARRSSCAVTVVGWDAWSGVGMGTVAGPFSSEEGHAERLRGALTPAEGVEAFARILRAGHGHVLVSTRDLTAGFEGTMPPDESRRASGPAPTAPDPGVELAGRERVVGEVWRELLGVDRIGPQDDFFALGGHSLLATQMLNRLRRRLPGVDVKLEDVFRAPTVAGLAARIEAAEAAAGSAAKSAPSPSRAPAGEAAGIRGVVLVLCTPRSGSTLFRLMLSGHPQLFCPPELWLLGHATLSEWSRDPFSVVYRDGLVRAFAGLDGGREPAPQELVEELVRRGMPVADVYRMLRERSGGRMLIDKTPGYVLDRAALAQAERVFHEARYVHLVRHPLASIESFVRSRFDRFLEERGDPREIAERTWADGNGNALEFRAALPPGRHLLVRYEALVRTPVAVMQEVCAFLDVPFDEDVLRPYERGRMFEGPGDPGLRAHAGIDPSRADAWKTASASAVGTRTRSLAAALGYELPA
ncbi:MAG: SDR family NAD(P)-dependent oxidoreductase [Candidatus Eiseniibacteriota bacterium]